MTRKGRGTRAALMAAVVVCSFGRPSAAGPWDGRSFGVGDASCGRWLEAHIEKGSEAALQDSWVLGFMSAFAKYKAKGGIILPSSDIVGISAALSRKCGDAPSASINTTLEKMLFEIDLGDRTPCHMKPGENHCSK